MKKLLVAGIAAAAFLSAPVLAAPPPAGVFNWSGFYIGVNGGDLSSKTKGTFGPGVLIFDSARDSVGTAGVHGGLQGQWGNIVAGIEGGFNAALSDKFGSTPPSAAPPCAYSLHSCDGRINDLLTAGGRLGWAWNNLLLYGSGGYANGAVEIRGGSVGGSAIQDDDTRYHPGWYGGAGIEYAVLNHLTIGIDWKHFDLGNRVHFNPNAGNLIEVSTRGDAVTARLTIKQ